MKRKGDSDDVGEEKETKDSPAKKRLKGSSSGGDDSSVSIQNLDLKADCVTLINAGLKDEDISDWKVDSSVGSQHYSFGSGSVLKAGDTVTVWSGSKNKDKDNPPNSLFWTGKYIWNDKGDTAVLKNNKGDVVDSKEEKPSVESKNMIISKLDLIADYVSISNRGNSDVDLKGWFVKSCVGDQHFVFAEGTVIKAGQTINIWSGKNSDKRNNPPFSFAWTKRFIWNNEGDSAALYNNAGDLEDKIMVFPDGIKNHVTPPTETRK